MVKSIRKSITILVVIALLFVTTMTSTASAADVDSTCDLESYYNVNNSQIMPMTSFTRCPREGCSGTVILTCSGKMKSDTDVAFTCNLPEHNEYEACKNYKVTYYNDGYCNVCNAPMSELIKQGLGDYYTYHTHGYKHVFSVGNGNYVTEYKLACYI